MSKELKTKLKNAGTRKAKKILVKEFKKRGYPKTQKGADDFQTELCREIPGINKLALALDKDAPREIEDIIMDAFNIPG